MIGGFGGRDPPGKTSMVFGYMVFKVQVTEDPAEIAEEFAVDPDERRCTAAAQLSCSKVGVIVARSQWGWLRVKFNDGSQSRWFTPFCLWLLSPSSLPE